MAFSLGDYADEQFLLSVVPAGTSQLSPNAAQVAFGELFFLPDFASVSEEEP
jgi:hypothetical protein